MSEMIRMYPKAVVLTAHHPFGGTEMMAQSLAFALNANGYDARVINVSDGSLQSLPSLLADRDLQLVMTTGTLPLGVRLDGGPLWRGMKPWTSFLVYLIDAWPYDAIRVPAFVEFLSDWRAGQPRLHLASLEGNDARLLGAHFMPTGAYPAPWRTAPRRHGDRLMIWASAHKELSVATISTGFEDTLRANDAWGLDDARVRRIGERLRHTDVVHGLSAIADAFDVPLPEIAVDANLVALAALDSCLKRHRRVKVVRALRGLPVDIYGENWGPYADGVPDMRVLTPNPNHNHAFSYLVQDYAGLVNFDPNFGDGTNERAVSALAMGMPIANNFNRLTDGVPGVHAYHFSDDSIRHAAERVLSHRDPVPTPAGNTWEYRLGGLLAAIAAGVREPARTATPAPGRLPRAADPGGRVGPVGPVGPASDTGTRPSGPAVIRTSVAPPRPALRQPSDAGAAPVRPEPALGPA